MNKAMIFKDSKNVRNAQLCMMVVLCILITWIRPWLSITSVYYRDPFSRLHESVKLQRGVSFPPTECESTEHFLSFVLKF